MRLYSSAPCDSVISDKRSFICIICLVVYFLVGTAIALAAGVAPPTFWGMPIADEFDKGAAAYKQGRYETAASIFEKLAEKGDHRAMSILGSMYADGLGVSLDPKKAFVWFKEAAKNNRPDAEYRLGSLYDHGLGVPQNNRKAIRWYQKATQHGYAPAQAMMGLKYARGDGFKRDKIKAYAWLSLSAPSFTGDEVELNDAQKAVPLEDRQDVVKVFERLQEELTPEEKETAAGLAREIAAKSGTTFAASPTGQSQGTGKDGKCVHGCLRWGEFCNVDPRGDYKCRRRCEEFGEICE